MAMRRTGGKPSADSAEKMESTFEEFGCCLYCIFLKLLGICDPI